MGSGTSVPITVKGRPVIYIGDHDGSSPCRAVCMAVKAANIQVDLRRIGLSTGETQASWFKKINPNGRVPALVDDGFNLCESRAILRYLVDQYAENDSLYPRDIKKRSLIESQFDMDTDAYAVMKAYVLPQLLQLLPADPVAEEKVRNMMTSFDNHPMLKAGKYLTGDDVTIADISLCASLDFLRMAEWDYSPYSNIICWQEKMKSHSWFQEVNPGFEDFLTYIKTPQFKEVVLALLNKG